MNYKFILFFLFALGASFVHAAPPIISYSGKVSVDGQPYTGTGLFKFAILNAENNATLWSNDGTSVNGSQPSASVGISVNGGLYSILLGNNAISGMGSIDPTIFQQHNDTRLRIWFSDGQGFEQLTPDRRFASVPYALNANIAPGSIKNQHLSPAVRSDLNRTITKSMLGSDVLNDLNATIGLQRLSATVRSDLNRTITKSMLGTDVLNDLNRTINSHELSVGVFAPEFTTYPLEISPTRFADDLNLADLNNDGALDIIDSSGLITLSNGKGGFMTPFSVISAGNAGKTLAVADFNSDNYPDIFLGRWQNTHWVFFGDENCSYTRKIEIIPNIDPSGFLKASDSFVLDVENDGDLDIILSHGHSVQGLLLTNPGDGNFTFSRPNGFSAVKNFVSGADFNGDGLTDIVASYYSNPKKNEGDGSFTNFPNSQLWEIGNLNLNNGELIVNDLDNNGDNDIIIFEGSGKGCTVFLNADGNGTFVLGSKFAINLTNIQSFDLGDLDNDGDSDIFLLGDQAAYLFINDGSGNFFRGSHVIQTTSGSSVKLGDLDNDGDLDAVISRGTHQSHQKLQVWWNDHAKGKVRLEQLEDKILEDLNRTITKSMLSSDVLSDLNRTITKNMLSSAIQNELNASSARVVGASLTNPYGSQGTFVFARGEYTVPQNKVMVVTSVGNSLKVLDMFANFSPVIRASNSSTVAIVPSGARISSSDANKSISGLLFSSLPGIEPIIGSVTYKVPLGKTLVITSSSNEVNANLDNDLVRIRNAHDPATFVTMGNTVSVPHANYRWSGYLIDQTNDAPRYWRMVIADQDSLGWEAYVYEMQLKDKDGNVVSGPNLGTAQTSTKRNQTETTPGIFDASMVFDGSESTFLQTEFGNGKLGKWISYTFNQGQWIHAIRVKGYSGASNSIPSWHIEYSMDNGSSWTKAWTATNMGALWKEDSF
jgi:hypothetical protein